jgi:exodeoxyribonuclease X
MSGKFVRVIDFETTGLDPATADVIEAGWCDVYSPDYRIDGPYSLLVQIDRPIEIEARAAHHIAPEDLAGGVSRSAWQARLSQDGPVAYIAHNSRFEASFWPEAPAPWICTYKSAMRLFPEAPRFTNSVLRYWLDLDADPGFNRSLAMPPHRAGPDAYVTAHIFVRMLRLVERSLSRLFQWTIEPELPPRVMFGKHFGVAWADVPADYLAWILRQTDFDEGGRWTASRELARREAERQEHLGQSQTAQLVGAAVAR